MALARVMGKCWHPNFGLVEGKPKALGVPSVTCSGLVSCRRPLASAWAFPHSLQSLFLSFFPFFLFLP